MIDYILPVQQEVKSGESIMSPIHNGKGMIVIGYQGIGKSTLASKRDGIIDLESSNFKIDGERDENWYIIYCRIAVSLACQGYIVLISSHECVRSELRKYNPNNPKDKYTVVIICPHYALEDQWIQRLHNRYIQDRSDKNYAAWKDAETHFADSIQSMTRDVVFSIILLDSMDYDLGGLIMSLYRASQPKAHFSQRIREEGC